MKRKATAEWQGPLQGGKGSMSTASGAIVSKPYSYTTRFENEQGTNPEELIGAAHAGCFSMFLAGQLGKMGFTATNIATTATVTLDKTEAGMTITAVHLDVKATVPGADPAKFQEAIANSKTGCPVSRLLKAEITVTAVLA